jgi:hypothetical protein
VHLPHRATGKMKKSPCDDFVTLHEKVFREGFAPDFAEGVGRFCRLLMSETMLLV